MKLTRARRGFLVVIPVVFLALVATSGDNPDPLPANASIGNLAAVFAPCRRSHVDTVPPLDFFSSAVGWLRVERVVVANRETDESEPTPPARVLARESIASDLTDVGVDVHFSFWPGIDWTLANGGEVWLALGDPSLYRNSTGNPVLYALSFTADGRAFFPGSCQHKFLHTPLQGKFGESFDETMRAIVGKTGDQLQALVDSSA